MYRQLFKWVIITLFTFCISTCGDPNRPDTGLTGLWEGTITGYSQVSLNESPLVLNLTQDERNLTGTVSLPEAGRVHTIENGNLDEFFIRFGFTSSGQTTSFSGSLKGRNIEGTWSLTEGQDTIESGHWQVTLISR
ncbi:MAG: hypothetical protein ACNA8K_06385 [Cyclonatronaceae bacterium]